MGDVDPYAVTPNRADEPHLSPADASPGVESSDHPERIGRYRVERILGKGGFGLVYLARDEQLDRLVAIKVPHARLVSKAEYAEDYLTEARTLANLDHPHIVPVYDSGSTNEIPCYIVSKYVEGSDLSVKLKRHRIRVSEAAELVATVADALHYAHRKGLVHRDVKPGNILIGTDSKPYVVDFGLALRESNIGKGPQYAGTPAYMSPEQARGEGHRVDGRSDIYSLGAVLYELLAGRRTFKADSQAELLEQITSQEVRPPRQIDDSIPKELERICLKALSKRASDRYTAALDMAEDLQHFLAARPAVADTAESSADETHRNSDTRRVPTDSDAADSDSRPIRIVPKGLRSFDEHDADFFLELLPGPRDRDGLPDSIRFWKTRMEENDADMTFSVGLIYGPSGCGKSSLVKAGLLPRLSEKVIPVYIEATPDETETRLLQGLRKRCPALADHRNLTQTMAALRRGQGISPGKKVVIVLDQFEQWLHANREQENTDLVQALRQCDGGRVQCMVMVRDDFWLAVSRFLRELEVRLLEGHNIALADLFDLHHARKVLAAFGRAFGKLPENENVKHTSREQQEFLHQSVAGLAEEGKVICVRLALFAEMMKGKTWTPATLKQVGGTQGVGVTFLEETFSSSTASPEHRYHQKAARAVLKALLPASGTDIKGQMKSRDQLLEASAYAGRPSDFDDLVTILDREIRLITPTDPAGMRSDDDSVPHAETGQKYYQLTHDYLVHSLRDWLTRKQQETRTGRAELRLAERSALWNAKPENSRLPSLFGYLSIRLHTGSSKWTEPQRKMMRRAARIHGLRAFAGLLLLTVAIVAGLASNRNMAQTRKRDRAESLVTSLKKADIENVPGIVREIDSFREAAGAYLDEQLREEHEKAADESPEKLRTALALLPVDRQQLNFLGDRLLVCSMDEFGVILDSLRPHRDALSERLWSAFRDEEDQQKRLRAGLALAKFVPGDDQWTDEDAKFLVDTLLGHVSEEQPQIRNHLTEIKTRLYVDLERAFRDPLARERQEIGSAKAFAQFAADDIGRIAELAAEATAAQHAVLYPVLEASSDQAVRETLRAVVAQQPDERLSQLDRVALGRRRAAAAITLLRMGERETFFDVFRVTDDPESLTQFVHRCRERGVTVAQLLDCLGRADKSRRTKSGDPRRLADRVLFAVLLALGEFAAADVPSPQREQLVSRLVDWYANDPSSAVHGACGWLLRHWSYEEEAEKIDQTEIPYAQDREWFIQKIDAQIPGSAGGDRSLKSFYFTFIVFEDGEYVIGSPDDEAERDDDEAKQLVNLTRRFAVLDREITREEFEAFGGARKASDQWSPPPGKHPVVGPSWYEGVAFCRALTTRMGLPEKDQCYADPAMLPEDFPREPDPQFSQYPRNWEIRLDRSGFRLPTEAEWEVICRAETSSMYNFGSDPTLLNRYGWFVDNAGKQTQLPRSLRPNLRGLFDTHGNVWEWCHDWFGSREAVNAEDPFGPIAGSSRVLRGGGWSSSASSCRSARRHNYQPTRQSTNDGFRVVSVVLFPSRP